MHVPRPPVDLARARKALDTFTAVLGPQLGQLKDDPSVLSSMATDALSRAALLTVLDPGSPELVRSLRTCARAAAAVFALGRAGRPLELPLDSDLPVRLEGAVDPSLRNGRLWDLGAWTALCCDEPGAFALLAAVPGAELTASPSRGPRSAYATSDALRLVGLAEPSLATRLVESLELLDPAGMDPDDAEIAVRLEAPPLDLMFTALQGDRARLDADLARALELFEGYWTGQGWSPAALFPHALAGAARFAALRGVPPTVTSDYLPPSILAAPPRSAPVVCCPYCRTPLAKGVSVCPACLEDPRRDAPLELTPAEYRAAPREPCPLCAAPKASRAVRCPSCRRRVPR